MLSAHSTTCKEVRVKGVHENCVFQLSAEGGAKRTFLASTPQDRDAWMKAIFTAMILIPSSVSETGDSTAPSEGKRTSFNFFKGRNPKVNQQSHNKSSESLELLLYSSPSSLPGPAAKYAQDISVFCLEQSRFAMTESADGFKNLLMSLRESCTSIRIPVFFVKVIIIII
jgi:hypothetical protein